ncbi:MAG: mechanosensitive ion channel family protein [Actinomycetota bacterium]|nr:mechanosensitive ion channel family protein [Actinomycetota bacterium]
MHDGKQIDLSAQVELVKRKTRPWKSIIALVLAIAAAVVSQQSRDALHRDPQTIFSASHLNDLSYRIIDPGAAMLFLIFGCIATYSLAGKSRELLKPKAGTSHAAVVGYVILIVGAFATLVITLELFGVPIGQLVLGGALTSVFVGIAAQQALGNVFAGLVLQFARPFHVGDAVRLRAGALGGTLDGVVIDIGITYVRFDADGSVMSVPNSQVLNAVVGPIPPEPEEQPSPAVVADSRSGSPGGLELQQPRPPGPA